MLDGLPNRMFPQVPLDKTKARSLLAHLAHPQMGELPLSAADRRKTEQWAILIH